MQYKYEKSELSKNHIERFDTLRHLDIGSEQTIGKSLRSTNTVSTMAFLKELGNQFPEVGELQPKIISMSNHFIPVINTHRPKPNNLAIKHQKGQSLQLYPNSPHSSTQQNNRPLEYTNTQMALPSPQSVSTLYGGSAFKSLVISPKSDSVIGLRNSNRFTKYLDSAQQVWQSNNLPSSPDQIGSTSRSSTNKPYFGRNNQVFSSQSNKIFSPTQFSGFQSKRMSTNSDYNGNNRQESDRKESMGNIEQQIPRKESQFQQYLQKQEEQRKKQESDKNLINLEANAFQRLGQNYFEEEKYGTLSEQRFQGQGERNQFNVSYGASQVEQHIIDSNLDNYLSDRTEKQTSSKKKRKNFLEDQEEIEFLKKVHPQRLDVDELVQNYQGSKQTLSKLEKDTIQIKLKQLQIQREQMRIEEQKKQEEEARKEEIQKQNELPPLELKQYEVSRYFFDDQISIKDKQKRYKELLNEYHPDKRNYDFLTSREIFGYIVFMKPVFLPENKTKQSEHLSEHRRNSELQITMLRAFKKEKNPSNND